MNERRYLISLAICVAALTFKNAPADASLSAVTPSRRSTSLSNALPSPHDFVLKEASPISGGILAHSSHAPHASHVSSSTAGDPGTYVPATSPDVVATSASTPANPSATQLQMPARSTPAPKVTKRASGQGWHPYKIVHVAEDNPLIYDIELSDDHIYRVQKHVSINWVPGDDAGLRTQLSKVSHKIYYALLASDGSRYEVVRIK